MKKLNLKLQDLAVESFPTQELPAHPGTVRANQESQFDLCDTEEPWLCTADLSCDYGCNTAHDGTCPSGNTCQQSCGGSCQVCQTVQTCFEATCPDTVCCPSQPC